VFIGAKTKPVHPGCDPVPLGAVDVRLGASVLHGGGGTAGRTGPRRA